MPPGGGPRSRHCGARCRDAGVEIVSYGSYLGFAPADATDETGTIEAVLDSAEALGAPDGPDLDRARREPRVARRRTPPRHRAHRPLRRRDRRARPARRARVPPVHPHGDRGVGQRAARRARSTGPQHALATRPRALGRCRARRARARSRRISRTCTSSRGARPASTIAHALADGADLWPPALALADRDGATLPGRRYALCEYVRDDDPEQLVADVRVLRRWLDALPDHRPDRALRRARDVRDVSRTQRCPVAPVLNVCLATADADGATMIRLGYAYGHYGRDRSGLFDAVLEQARAAEDAGYDSVWVPDHLMQATAVAPVDDPMIECYTTLGALAAVTSNGPSRRVRRLPGVPQRRAAGKDPHHARRHLRRARHVRDRRGVVRHRAHRLRLRPRTPRRAVRAPRGNDRDRAVDVRERDDDLSREALSGRGRAELAPPGAGPMGCRS